MAKQKKEVKFSNKDGRRPSRNSDNPDATSDTTSPTRSPTSTKPQMNRTESLDGNWTDDEKVSKVRLL